VIADSGGRVLGEHGRAHRFTDRPAVAERLIAYGVSTALCAGAVAMLGGRRILRAVSDREATTPAAQPPVRKPFHRLRDAEMGHRR